MINNLLNDINRRAFLGRGAAGLGLVALNSLINPRLLAAAQAANRQSKGVVNPLHFPPKAKRVIFLYQAGGPSHLETFDYKPKLAEMNGKPMPESFTKGQQIAQLQGKKLICFGPQSRIQAVRQIRPADVRPVSAHRPASPTRLCIIRSMWTEQINHDPAHTFMNTGSIITGRPSMGSWVLYGLGAEADEPAGIRRADVSRQGRTESADRGAPMVGRHPAEQISGREIQLGRAIRCSTSRTRRASVRETAVRFASNAINALNQNRSIGAARSRNPDAHRAV